MERGLAGVGGEARGAATTSRAVDGRLAAHDQWARGEAAARAEDLRVMRDLLGEERATLRAELAEEQRRLAGAQRRIATVEGDLAMLRARAESLAADVERLRAERDRWAEEAGDLRAGRWRLWHIEAPSWAFLAALALALASVVAVVLGGGRVEAPGVKVGGPAAPAP